MFSTQLKVTSDALQGVEIGIAYIKAEEKKLADLKKYNTKKLDDLKQYDALRRRRRSRREDKQCGQLREKMIKEHTNYYAMKRKHLADYMIILKEHSNSIFNDQLLCRHGIKKNK